LDQPKRKHVRTGKKPPGGKREGAGRVRGTLNSLGYGEVRALKVAGLRVPDEATADDARLADAALGRAIDVMMGQVHKDDAPHILKAATYVRAQVCERDELGDEDGPPLSIQIIRRVSE
jgi:hypothetical protein